MRVFQILVLIISQIHYTTAPVPCGTSAQKARGTRQVDAVAHSWPWAVYIKSQENAKRQCTGTLLPVCRGLDKTDVLVTAASCFSYYDTAAKAPMEENLGDFQILIGAHDISAEYETGRQPKMGAATIKEYRRYLPLKLNGLTVLNDLAVVSFHPPARFTDKVRPLCMTFDELHAKPTGTMCHVAGWGLDADESGYGFSLLRQVPMRVQEDFECAERLGALPENLHSNEDMPSTMCLTPRLPDLNLGRGDAGAPVMCRSPKSGRYELHGVVSAGHTTYYEAYAPALREPEFNNTFDVALWVSSNPYYEWIQERILEITAIKGECHPSSLLRNETKQEYDY